MKPIASLIIAIAVYSQSSIIQCLETFSPKKQYRIYKIDSLKKINVFNNPKYYSHVSGAIH